MKNVLIAGAGKSSTYLIDYMLRNAKNNWTVTVMDSSAEAVAEKIAGHAKGEAAVINIEDDKARKELVKKSDLVISLMPPALHILLAKDCLEFGKNLITSSYVSEEMKAMHEEAVKKDLLFMCEMGLDPGIDHMSANKIIHSIQKISGDILSFKSYCGGLISPENDDNPWHYKISWNAKNIVNAGKEGAEWIENGHRQKLEYEQLFEQVKKVKINDELGSWAYYPNRNSHKYRKLYDIEYVPTFVRATLRHPQFMKAWSYIVKANLNDDTDAFESNGNFYSDWISWKTGLKNDENLRDAFMEKYKVDDKSAKMIDWLGLFTNKQIYESRTYSSAEILQIILEEKWVMKPMDKDLVVMQHQVEYERRGVNTHLVATLVVKGENRNYSAMAKCVGLPMAILAKRMLLHNDLKRVKGVQIPIIPEVYVPILKELKKYDIEFIETID